MNCPVCHAQLAPPLTTCCFCGTSLPAPPPPLPLPAGPSEGWRLWASVLLGGFYGPVAGTWMLRRAEHAFQGTGALPVPPSRQALAAVGMLLGVPLLFVATLLFVFDVERIATARFVNMSATAMRLEFARVSWWAVCFVAAHAVWLVVGVLRGQWLQARFEALLACATREDPQVLLQYRTTARWRPWVTIVALLPLLAVGWFQVCLLLELPAIWFRWLVEAYLLLLPAGIWAVSWLTITPALQYAQARTTAP